MLFIGVAQSYRGSTGIPADTRETVLVSAGDGPVRSEQKFSFTTAAYSTLRLQELFAQLGYLPMSWAPAAGAPTCSTRARSWGSRPTTGWSRWLP